MKTLHWAYVLINVSVPLRAKQKIEICGKCHRIVNLCILLFLFISSHQSCHISFRYFLFITVFLCLWRIRHELQTVTDKWREKTDPDTHFRIHIFSRQHLIGIFANEGLHWLLSVGRSDIWVLTFWSSAGKYIFWNVHGSAELPVRKTKNRLKQKWWGGGAVFYSHFITWMDGWIDRYSSDMHLFICIF